MNGEWCYFKSYFSKQQCEEIINLGMQQPSQDALVGLNGSAVTDDANRRSTIRFLPKNEPQFKPLFEELWKTAIQANHDFFNVHITKLDFVQLAEYDYQYQGEYKDHHDVFWLNNDPFYHRKLSCIIQLSDPDDYVGGDFEMGNHITPLPREDCRLQGTVIYFPSFLVHRATPVIRGTRYSIAAWFDGPKWR